MKKYHGIDHYQTAHTYVNLGLFYLGSKKYKKASKCMIKALYIMNFIAGESV